MTYKFADKDPNDNRHEWFDWSALVGTDNITGEPIVSVATAGAAESGDTEQDNPTLQVTEGVISGNTVLFDMSGGTLGVKYWVTCQVETVSGQTFNRRASVTIKDL